MYDKKVFNKHTIIENTRLHVKHKTLIDYNHENNSSKLMSGGWIHEQVGTKTMIFDVLSRNSENWTSKWSQELWKI